MDDNTARVLLATLPSIVTGFLTWHITRRSERQHYAKQWWERKSQAYTDAMGALSDADFVIDVWHGRLVFGYNFSDEYKATLHKRLAAAASTIKKLAGTGRFLISDDAATALHVIAVRLDYPFSDYDEMDDIEKDLKAVATCMDTVKAAAAVDLKIA